jgi:DNA polymerase III subunit beta
MEFTVARADLVRELGLSQGVVEKRSTIPILSNILVEAQGDSITLTATDLELGIRCTAPAKVKKAGAGTIPAKRLFDHVRLLEGDIQVKVGDNHWANITSGRAKTRIAGMSRESYPELPAAGERIADLPAKAFGAMIAETIFAISNEESRFTLNGALLVLRADAMIMVTTDGHRLAIVERATELGGVGFRALVPRKALTELQRLIGEAGADDVIHFSANDNHLFFEVGSRLLISRKLTGNFPDYERVLPKDERFQIALSRDQFKQMIERVAQFSDERSHAVRFTMGEGELKVHSSQADTGESEDALPVDYNGAVVDIGFNATYVLDFLKASPESQIAFLFKDAASAGELRPLGADDTPLPYQYRYVIMPMRI